MKRRFIFVEETFREWTKNPKFRAAYDALEEEFALAGALIEAWGDLERNAPDAARMSS